MAVISFNASDYMQTKVVEAAIYTCAVSKLEGPKKSGSGKSNNYFVDITICEGPYKGKTRTIVFNTETNSPSLLGEAQFYPDAYFLQLAAAIGADDGQVKEQFNLDTDNLMFKPFDCSWGITTVDGHLINTINAFHPKGYGATAPGF